MKRKLAREEETGCLSTALFFFSVSFLRSPCFLTPTSLLLPYELFLPLSTKQHLLNLESLQPPRVLSLDLFISFETLKDSHPFDLRTPLQTSSPPPVTTTSFLIQNSFLGFLFFVLSFLDLKVLCLDESQLKVLRLNFFLSEFLSTFHPKPILSTSNPLDHCDAPGSISGLF